MADRSVLMIIGNGFDLQCGLKSGYEDFFDWLDKNTSVANTTVWTINFLTNLTSKNQLWADVESNLLEALSSRYTMKRWESESSSRQSRLNDDYGRNMGEHIRRKAPMTSGEGSLDMYWYLDELITFERRFAQYLKEQVESNTSYLPNATKLMNLMIEDNEKVNIINFNYTNPFNSDSPNSEGRQLKDIVSEVTNVHGTLDDNNNIFGVDATAQLENGAHIFTKTYRKMLQDSPSRALPWHVHKIKFYGHSLGSADYSYFHSIFDNYNLYGGDLAFGQPRNEQVELQFYFTVYDESKKIEITRNATERVHNLITAYGATLDNKDKGKNLLHKLLLEGRLKIELLDDIGANAECKG